MSRARAGVIDGERGFVLHLTPFRETSLIAELFTREHGRVSAVARGARRPQSKLRGALMEFQPLELAWFGQGEVKTVARAEWLGGQALLSGRALLYGYYLSELLLNFVAREDAHPLLFDAYERTMARLAAGDLSPAVLRIFEHALLREAGHAPAFDRASGGGSIRPDRQYALLPEQGLVDVSGVGAHEDCYPGSVLLAIAADDYRAADTRRHGMRIMRNLIDRQLGDKALHSRRLFQELLQA